MELPKDLKDEIWEYCRLNDITDLNAFILRMLRQGYTTEKYGPTPFKIGGEVEKEVIVEKIVEVPVEVIKEVEVVKEIPVVVEKEVIKEVEKIVELPIEKIVTKIEYISDKTGEDELIKKITELEKEIKDIKSQPPLEVIKEVEKIVEVPIEVIKEIEVEKIVEVIREVEINNDDKVKKLENQIENLKIELELEKNRHIEMKKIEQPKDVTPTRNPLTNIINWVSKSEREDKDLYGE